MLNEKEIAERQKYSDPRVFFAIEQAKKEILRNEEHANANNTRIAENTE